MIDFNGLSAHDFLVVEVDPTSVNLSYTSYIHGLCLKPSLIKLLYPPMDSPSGKGKLVCMSPMSQV